MFTGLLAAAIFYSLLLDYISFTSQKTFKTLSFLPNLEVKALIGYGSLRQISYKPLTKRYKTLSVAYRWMPLE